MESKEIKVYGTLVNETVGTVTDASHNDILMNAYQLYDGRFINNGGVNNYQDVINKRLTAITYANGVTTITGDLTVTGTTNTNNLGVTNNTTTKNLTVSDDASIKNITSSGNTTLQNVTVNGTTTANGTTTFNEDVTFNDNAQFKEDVTFGDNVTFNSNITFSQNTTISGVSLNDLSDVNTSGAADGNFLKFNGTNWVPASITLSNLSGGISLSDLSNVNTTGATNGSVLKYNGTSWVVGTDIEGTNGATDLNGLSSVAVSSPQNGQVLYYDSTSGKWVNRKLSLSDITMPNASEGQVLKYTSGAWIAATDNTSSGSSSGGGVTLNQPLSAINSANLGAPSQSNVGLVWNGSAWTYQSLSGNGSSSGTQSGTITIGGVEAVDLGLSVKWATHNIGATNLIDTGYSFEYGNPTPITTLNRYKRWSSKIVQDNQVISTTNMSGDDIYGNNPLSAPENPTYYTGLGTLPAANDMATQTLGNGWFTPTYDHYTELLRNTTMSIYLLQPDNKWILKFTAKNGNYILLPFCGALWMNEALPESNFTQVESSRQSYQRTVAPSIDIVQSFNNYYANSGSSGSSQYPICGLVKNENDGMYYPSDTIIQRLCVVLAMGSLVHANSHMQDHRYYAEFQSAWAFDGFGGLTDRYYQLPVRAVHY